MVERIERLSKTVFKKQVQAITGLIGNSHGIYALYDGSDLYYVGKSTDLRSRVKAHLRDRHLASWTHFSLYLVRDSEHLGEIESLLVRIANPKGNKVLPRGRGESNLRRKLEDLVRKHQREELAELFGPGQPAHVPDSEGAGKKAAQTRDAIVGLVHRCTTLYRSYRGKEFRAQLYPTGIIMLGGRRFKSPTAAGKAITGWPTCNGWTFWYIKNSDGEWVTLADYRK